MVKLLLKLSILFFPLGIALICTNYKLDPANLFQNGSYEDGMVKILQSGKHVTGISNYNERLLQKKLIQNMRNCPETIVLGSSRIMELRNDNIKSGSFFNYGVSMCVIEDIGCIFEMYVKKKCTPKKIYLGLDPWMLNQNDPMKSWKYVYYEYHHEFLKRIGITENNTLPPAVIDPHIWELISLSYFQESIRKRQTNAIDRPTYWPTSHKINNTFTKLTDGSVTYNLTYRSKSAEELNEFVKGHSERIVKSTFLGYSEISEEKKAILYNFLLYLKKNKIEVEILLSPFHPYTYKYLLTKQKYNMLDDAEITFRGIANKLNIPIKGSYNPETLGLDSTYFYDESHSNAMALKIILTNSLLESHK